MNIKFFLVMFPPYFYVHKCLDWSIYLSIFVTLAQHFSKDYSECDVISPNEGTNPLAFHHFPTE